MVLRANLIDLRSLYGFAYLQPSLIAVPKVPRYFAVERDGITDKGITQLLALEDSFNERCTVSEIFYRIMIYCASPKGQPGNEEDLEARKLLHHDLWQWKAALPSQDRYEPRWKWLHNFMKYGTSPSLFYCFLYLTIVHPGHSTTLPQLSSSVPFLKLTSRSSREVALQQIFVSVIVRES